MMARHVEPLTVFAVNIDAHNVISGENHAFNRVKVFAAFLGGWRFEALPPEVATIKNQFNG